MNGLPKDVDLSFFIGTRLELVCIGKYQLYLHFSNGIVVTVEGTLSLNDVVVKEHRDAPTELTKLLEIEVVEASGTDGDVVLTFSNRNVLVIHDSNKSFESYSISAPNRPTLFV